MTAGDYARSYRSAVRRARYGRARLTPRQALGLLIAGVVAFGALGSGASKVVTGSWNPVGLWRPSHAATQAIGYAHAQLGGIYCWGGVGSYCPTPPYHGYDCSGLTMEAYASAGVTIPRVADAQWFGLPHVKHPQPGDLVFFAGSDGTWSDPGHVGLVVGPHMMIDAYGTGYGIREEPFGRWADPVTGMNQVIGFARPTSLVRVAAPPPPAAASSYTAASWAAAFLRGAGYRTTPANLAAVCGWQAQEGDWATGHTGWHNPLNATRPEPGSRGVVYTGTPGVWVQAYPTWGAGLQASLTTLSGPDYAPIRAALTNGTSAAAAAAAVAASPWGTRPFNPGSC